MHDERDEWGMPEEHGHDDHDHGNNGFSNPAEEGSPLHLEIHRAVDELGKYAVEIEIDSDGGVPKAEMKGFVEDLMRTATASCMSNGADLVGHVKSFLIVGKESVMSSLVDERLPVKVKDTVPDGPIRSAKLILHVIVHGIWDDKIRELTLAALPDVAGRWGLRCTVIADYFDVEKSIAHHNVGRRACR